MKQKRTLLILSILALGELFVSAQTKSTVEIQKGEKWWGGFTALGSSMPYIEPTKEFDFKYHNFNNQGSGFFVSNLGRYIFLEEPAVWSFDGTKFLFDMPTAKAVATDAGKNLRSAYIHAANTHFKASGQMPPVEFFSDAQWNTWIELLYDQNEKDIMAYAENILKNGFKPGILMIDDNWQRYYGSYDFKAEKFSDPKAMVDKLHGMGFKVMLWVCPFVSADSPEYRDLASRGFLVKNSNGGVRIVNWWNGHSAVYDLLNPKAVEYVVEQLKATQTKYGIDGFKFDAGDVNFYDAKTANAQSRAWQDLALRFPYNELRASWGGGGQANVQRLGDKNYSWNALKSLIPDMIAASMLGYPYTCPDMVGGGQYGSFIGVDRNKLDQTLIVRWTQASALMPMIQFSVAPWNVLDATNLELARQAAALHEKFAPYITSLAREASQTGEPIIRPMEYQFPDQGFADCKDQFMLGSKYLVAPVMSADGKRMVRLPRGTWVDDLGKKIRGPQVIQIAAPLSRLPYYELK